MTSHGGGLKCLHCTADTVGVVLCKRCRTTLTVSLQNVASYHGGLFSLGGTTTVRAGKRSGPSDPTGTSAGNVQAEPAVERMAAETRTHLSTWARALLDDRAELSAPGDTVLETAAFLRRSLRSIATLEWAGEFMRTNLDLERRLHRLISQGQGHWYAGICAARTGDPANPTVDDWCPQDLFVHPGQTYVRCRTCGHSWSVSQRRAQILEQARETLLPVAVIARAAVSLLDGEPSVQRLEARLRKMVERGQLEIIDVQIFDGRPRRVYQLGEVIDRLTREAGVAR